MARSIGVLATGRIWAGMVEDTTLGDSPHFPRPGRRAPRSEVAAGRRRSSARFASTSANCGRAGRSIRVGAGFPGIVRDGMIEESPNLGQLKGLQMRERLAAALRQDGLDVPVCVMNDADALAAGVAATRGGSTG